MDKNVYQEVKLRANIVTDLVEKDSTMFKNLIKI